MTRRLAAEFDLFEANMKFSKAAMEYDRAWTAVLDGLIDTDAPVEDFLAHIRRRPRFVPEEK
jgi:hypothetical protein